MTICAMLWHYAKSFAVIFAMPVLALLINRWPNPWAHLVAQILGNTWFFGLLISFFLRRAPCHYGSYRDWYANRANWFQSFPS